MWKSKSMLRGDGLFKFLEGVNTNKVDLQGEYNVSSIFKVSNFYLFDVSDDSRLNPFEKREDDVILVTTLRDPFGVSIGSIL